jgi:hypothetical protein
MTNDQPLPPEGAALQLERRMLTLSRSVAADAPPYVVDVKHVATVGGVAVLLALVDVQFADGPIMIPVCVEIGEEPINTILRRLERVRPRLDAPMVH